MKKSIPHYICNGIACVSPETMFTLKQIRLGKFISYFRILLKLWKANGPSKKDLPINKEKFLASR